ncbi:hypothetical protein QRX50_02965 [Amycolatopsis carbonis]|uniref:Uncharacterized protein n=1 Tax=Amycolatopsis carbonis TaxID=715471 RepID=A0A9Y2IGS1_9PSEU|nr:hypothetical protein [Amycolatopsis sp. 2-15]WIX79777.1 hypothetical protein QRX50_02965 [Amycolatopsis sp. 2-15]
MTLLPSRMNTWHRPSTLFAAGLVVTALACVVAMVVDQRTVLGAPVWAKLLKFAISGALYFFTWGWLVSLLPRFRRTAHVATNVVIVLFAAEYVVMAFQAVRGRPSHFNNATPLDNTLFQLMGGMVAAIWIATLVLTVLLMFTRLEDRATHWAVRTGAVISLIGIALGALMTSPTAAQQQALNTTGVSALVGAHSVGVPDGGPGLPILGWSTTGGDLRIPHFTGMHALQLLPLVALGLELLASRMPRLRDSAVRVRLVWVATLGYAGLVALVTWQALRGESLIHPSAPTLAAFGALLAAVALAGCASAYRPTRELVR